jgi:hypothetical protein
MSPESSTFHEVTKQAVQEIARTANIPENRAFDMRTQAAEIDGKRHVVDITTSNDGALLQESTYAIATNSPLESDGSWRPLSGNVVAEIGHHVNNEGQVGSAANVATEAGKYSAVEGFNGAGSTRVERKGYGSVEITNPRAKELVAGLAGKVIQESQQNISNK